MMLAAPTAAALRIWMVMFAVRHQRAADAYRAGVEAVGGTAARAFADRSAVAVSVIADLIRATAEKWSAADWANAEQVYAEVTAHMEDAGDGPALSSS